MKPLCYLPLFLLLVSQVYAQDAPKSHQLKFYLDASWEERSISLNNGDGSTVTVERETFQFGQVIPAWAIQKSGKRTFTEWALNRLSVGVRDEMNLKYTDSSLENPMIIQGERVTALSVGVSWEWNAFLTKMEGRGLKPAIGLGVLPFFFMEKYVPKTSQFFPIHELEAGSRFLVIPRLQWHASDRLFLDLNIPLRIVQVDLSRSQVQDPTLPKEQQSQTAFNLNAPPQDYQVRLGLGWKIK